MHQGTPTRSPESGLWFEVRARVREGLHEFGALGRMPAVTTAEVKAAVARHVVLLLLPLAAVFALYAFVLVRLLVFAVPPPLSHENFAMLVALVVTYGFVSGTGVSLLVDDRLGLLAHGFTDCVGAVIAVGAYPFRSELAQLIPGADPDGYFLLGLVGGSLSGATLFLVAPATVASRLAELSISHLLVGARSDLLRRTVALSVIILVTPTTLFAIFVAQRSTETAATGVAVVLSALLVAHSVATNKAVLDSQESFAPWSIAFVVALAAAYAGVDSFALRGAEFPQRLRDGPQGAIVLAVCIFMFWAIVRPEAEAALGRRATPFVLIPLFILQACLLAASNVKGAAIYAAPYGFTVGAVVGLATSQTIASKSPRPP